MNFDPMQVRARLALRQMVRRYLFVPNVTCVDLGLPEGQGDPDPDDLRVRVHVRRKLEEPQLELAVAAGQTERLPRYQQGVRVDVLEGVYRPHAVAWALPADRGAGRENPLRGGVSISNERQVAYGTLGAKVIDPVAGQEMLLSNWHVLAGGLWARPGQRILQPGRLDGGRATDTVATLDRDVMAAGLDAAVATVTGDRRLVNDQLGLGPVIGVGQPRLGMGVVKSGRGSGKTTGRVTGVAGVARIRYGYLERAIRHVVTVDPVDDRQVSAGGDSGAVWLDMATGLAVGLHFAGSDVPERAMAMEMGPVLAALGVELDTTAPGHMPRARAWR